MAHIKAASAEADDDQYVRQDGGTTGQLTASQSPTEYPYSTGLSQLIRNAV